MECTACSSRRPVVFPDNGLLLRAESDVGAQFFSLAVIATLQILINTEISVSPLRREIWRANERRERTGQQAGTQSSSCKRLHSGAHVRQKLSGFRNTIFWRELPS